VLSGSMFPLVGPPEERNKVRVRRSSKSSRSVGLHAGEARNDDLIRDALAPQTLAECLTHRMIERGHTDADAAAELGTISLKVRWWAHDSYVPDPEDFGGLTAYLCVDLDSLKGLVLRSQMRQTQRRLREMEA
jgi:hypothetical protein